MAIRTNPPKNNRFRLDEGLVLVGDVVDFVILKWPVQQVFQIGSQIFWLCAKRIKHS